MKIGNRDITSFKDVIEQFQLFALNHPWLATVDMFLLVAFFSVITLV